jgi:alanyl-tRNA synthetase
LIAEAARTLHANNPADLVKRAQAVENELKEAHRACDRISQELSRAKLDALIGSAKQMGKVKVLTGTLHTTPAEARNLCDAVKGQYDDMVAVFAVVCDGKLNFVACCGNAAVKAGAHAGNLLREVAAVTGGKGGGRPDSAMSGGVDADKIPEALALAEERLSAL